jgi:succinate dehydrogenase/fumarate reductase-like Fe-S protein
MADEAERIIKVTVTRFNPRAEQSPRKQTYEVPVGEGHSVLNVLNYIYEKLDRTIGHYYSCRIGRCTGCDAVVNGEVKYTCSTVADGDLSIEPLPDYVLIKDLVVDKGRPRQTARRTEKLLGGRR